MMTSNRGGCFKNRLATFFVACFVVALAVGVQQVRPDDSDTSGLTSNCQLDTILRSLLTEDELANIHIQALRQDLLRILNSELLQRDIDQLENEFEHGQYLDDEYTDDDKRSVSALARGNQLPYAYKRNLGSLIRSGGLPRSGRSIANLAKNGQLPTLQSPEEEVLEEKRNLASLVANRHWNNGKRNIGSLARNGRLDEFLDALRQKRYLGALAKNGELSRYSRNNDEDKRSLQSLMRSRYLVDDKRNIAAVARDWALPNHSYDRTDNDKRNAAALLRQDSYMNGDVNSSHRPMVDDKRNLASLKAHATSRSKRQIDEDYYPANGDEYSMPVMQNTNSMPDYDDALPARYPVDDKRFLGNIPLSRMAELGKFSLMAQPATSNTTPTNPTYRRRQYLLSRTNSNEAEH